MALNKTIRFAAVVMAGLMLTACNTWSTSNVKLKTSGAEAANEISGENSTPQAKNPSDIIVTMEDITDRDYNVLADLDVSVNKTTIFNADPTREMIDAKLREEAAKINADAVILVRYGTVGIGLMSWGSLDGKGRAIAFVR